VMTLKFEIFIHDKDCPIKLPKKIGVNDKSRRERVFKEKNFEPKILSTVWLALFSLTPDMSAAEFQG